VGIKHAISTGISIDSRQSQMPRHQGQDVRQAT